MPLQEYQFTTNNGDKRYILAQDNEHAAWVALELSGGTCKLKDVKRTEMWT